MVIDMLSSIKPKTNEILGHALRAGNEIEFGQNENYLYIIFFCYEDVSYKIIERNKRNYI